MILTGTNTTVMLLAVGAIAVLTIVFVAVLLRQKRRTRKLRGQFGDAEYARTVDKDGGRRKAEAALQGRSERVDALHVRPLAAGDRARFLECWRGVQARFVDGPAGAVTEADQLLGDVMSTRGYPVSAFEQRTSDISVDHPSVVENYRTAHAIAERQRNGQANTEELRQAMIHYRTLFEELINEPEMVSPGALG